MVESFAPTSREIEVAGLLARGLVNKEISRRLGITVGTVKSHVTSFARKAGLDRASRVNLALAYLRLCDDVERDRIIGCSAPIETLKVVRAGAGSADAGVSA